MLEAGYRILRDRHDAEDAVGEAVITALTNRPELQEHEWGSWLCKVVQNKALDSLRKRKREQRLTAVPSVGEVVTDDFREFEIGADTRRLLDRIEPFLSDALRRNFPLYREVELGHVTVEELAGELDVPVRTLRSRLWRVGRAVQDAAVAICLADDPGTGPDRCLVPFSLADSRTASPKLLKEITTHVQGCGKCRRKRDRSGWLRRSILVVPGIGLTAALLAKLAQTMNVKKAAVMTSVAAVAVSVTFAVSIDQPDATPIPTVEGRPAHVPPQQPTAPAEPPSPPVTLLPPPGSVVAVPVPAPEPLPSPPTTTVVTSTPGGAPPDDKVVISDGWVEHRTIFTAEHQGRCGDRPTTSGVAATVTAPRGVRSVDVHLWHGNREVRFPMTNTAGTSRWHGRTGPLGGEDAGERFAVVVVVVDADGALSVGRIGELWFEKCS
jgi:DNA-directed RNA polymerase specialized sigma24 family protein